MERAMNQPFFIGNNKILFILDINFIFRLKKTNSVPSIAHKTAVCYAIS